MYFYNFILAAIYTTIIVIWVWARFRFFKIESDKSRLSSLFYDPIVSVQIVVTYLGFYSEPILHIHSFAMTLSLYIVGMAIFLLSIREAKSLNFAFSDRTSELITSGTYRLVRHPLYVSYFLVWLSNTILFNSILLWITLLYLAFFYYFSAKTEELIILRSSHSREYEEYRRNVGMFLPRIKGWKS